MTPYDFSRLMSSEDSEAICHGVFDQAHDKWTQDGRAALTEGELTVLCVEAFFGETLNGGLEQYLFNESGLLAQFGCASLRRVELDKYAVILNKTLARCTTTTEEDEDYADKIVTRHEPPETDDEDGPFSDLEEEFFALYFADKEEFRRHLESYIRNNEDQFVLPE